MILAKPTIVLTVPGDLSEDRLNELSDLYYNAMSAALEKLKGITFETEEL